MPRLLFEKTGTAFWMSHLDLMRVFQRSFKRAGLPSLKSASVSVVVGISAALSAVFFIIFSMFFSIDFIFRQIKIMK